MSPVGNKQQEAVGGGRSAVRGRLHSHLPARRPPPARLQGILPARTSCMPCVYISTLTRTLSHSHMLLLVGGTSSSEVRLASAARNKPPLGLPTWDRPDLHPEKAPHVDKRQQAVRLTSRRREGRDITLSSTKL
eukprot:9500920-Pyramimonas_sp.AAC.1